MSYELVRESVDQDPGQAEFWANLRGVRTQRDEVQQGEKVVCRVELDPASPGLTLRSGDAGAFLHLDGRPRHEHAGEGRAPLGAGRKVEGLCPYGSNQNG
jgi:hypothetical protein